MGIGPFDSAHSQVHEGRAPTVPSSTVLLTHRLRLRPIQKNDALALFGIFGDPEATRFWASPTHRTIAETSQMIRSLLNPKEPRCLSWGIAYRDEPDPVGVIWLNLVDPSSRRAKLKFVLGRRHWRQGLMLEALKRVLDHVFLDLALHRLEACLHVNDERSESLLHRLSFKREGTLRECIFVDNCYRDVDLQSLLARDWLDRLQGATPLSETLLAGRPLHQPEANRPEPLCDALEGLLLVDASMDAKHPRCASALRLTPAHARQAEERPVRRFYALAVAANLRIALGVSIGVATLFAKWRSERERNRDLTQLGLMSERELWSDLGLTKVDIAREWEMRGCGRIP